MEQRNNEFTFRRVATNGCEVHDPSGVVIAWTANELWAAIITHLLNNDGSAAGRLQRTASLIKRCSPLSPLAFIGITDGLEFSGAEGAQPYGLCSDARHGPPPLLL